MILCLLFILKGALYVVAQGDMVLYVELNFPTNNPLCLNKVLAVPFITLFVLGSFVNLNESWTISHEKNQFSIVGACWKDLSNGSKMEIHQFIWGGKTWHYPVTLCNFFECLIIEWNVIYPQQLWVSFLEILGVHLPISVCYFFNSVCALKQKEKWGFKKSAIQHNCAMGELTKCWWGPLHVGVATLATDKLGTNFVPVYCPPNPYPHPPPPPPPTHTHIPIL